jgi:hypothetical protein
MHFFPAAQPFTGLPETSRVPDAAYNFGISFREGWYNENVRRQWFQRRERQ